MYRDARGGFGRLIVSPARKERRGRGHALKRGAAQVPISLLQANAMPGLAMTAVMNASPIIENE
ncbi:hypothetical protein IE4803_CH03802 [Rhizobium etli bv. phaseoli str. IE4803]|nr:hypothetical protein IE4803_CH03802 [Rhizobium etli bv. phaseoli str. IE4803]